MATLLGDVCYRAEVDRCYPDARTASSRWSAVMEVLDLAENYVTRASRPSLADFLERLTLAAGDDPTADESDRRDPSILGIRFSSCWISRRATISKETCYERCNAKAY